MTSGKSASREMVCGVATSPVDACCMDVLLRRKGTKKTARGTSTGRRGSHVATYSAAHTPPLASRGPGHVVMAIGRSVQHANHGPTLDKRRPDVNAEDRPKRAPAW